MKSLISSRARRLLSQPENEAKVLGAIYSGRETVLSEGTRLQPKAVFNGFSTDLPKPRKRTDPR